MAHVCFSKTEVATVYLSHQLRYVDEIWFAHINFDLLKAAISTNAKPEIVLLRFGRHVVLSRLPPRPLNTTGISGFAFLNIAAFRRSKSISKPNFGSEAPKA